MLKITKHNTPVNTYCIRCDNEIIKDRDCMVNVLHDRIIITVPTLGYTGKTNHFRAVYNKRLDRYVSECKITISHYPPVLGVYEEVVNDLSLTVKFRNDEKDS